MIQLLITTKRLSRNCDADRQAAKSRETFIKLGEFFHRTEVSAVFPSQRTTYLRPGAACARQKVDDETGEYDEEDSWKCERAHSTDNHQPRSVLVCPFDDVQATQSAAVERLDVESPEWKETERHADDGQHDDDATHPERRRKSPDFERKRHRH